jgi:hypothetical protein
VASGKTTVETARAQQGQHDRAAVLARLRAKNPVRAEYRVHLSDEPIRALRDARVELDRAENILAGAANDAVLDYAREQVAQAREHVEKARAEAEADSVLMVFHGISREAFNALVDAHPPSEEDAKKGRDYDPATFPPALIAATCVDPGFDSPDEVLEVIGDWNMTERESLFTTAMSTCVLSRTADLGKGSAATLS